MKKTVPTSCQRRLVSVLALALLLAALAPAARAQESVSIVADTHSRVSGSSRYDIIQAPQGGIWRLDRFCGNVDQLAQGNAGGPAWKHTAPVPRACIIDRSHYELAISAATPPQLLLMNVDTGDSWSLKSLPDAPQGSPDTAWVPLGQ